MRFFVKTWHSEKKVDQLHISLLSPWGCGGKILYLYPSRNVFKAVLRLSGAVPKTIKLFEGCHARKECFLVVSNVSCAEGVVEISSRETRMKVVAYLLLTHGSILFMNRMK